MNDQESWNDEARQELREAIETEVIGEVRMGKQSAEDILLVCREGLIEEECPESEWPQFVEFARKEITSRTKQLQEEQASWPSETDCDRLDKVEAILREKGIAFWQLSPCCDSCTMSEFSEYVDEIAEAHEGFRERVKGYAFFIDQSVPEMLADSTQLSVFLGYGWFTEEEMDEAVYESKALEIAHEVCACLREHGFEIDWDETIGRKIGVSLNWQRRCAVN